MQGGESRQLPAAAAQSESAALRAAEESKAARVRLQALGQPPAGANAMPGFSAELIEPQMPNAKPGAAAEKAPQREWIPPPAGAAVGSGLGGALSGLTSVGIGSSDAADDRLRRFDPESRPSDDDNLLRLLPAEVRAFLRDNRYALLAGGVALALVGAIGMLYSRRV